MAYRITYGKDPKGANGNYAAKWGRTLAVLGVIGAVACVCFYVVNHVGLEKLLPGDPAVTGAALDTFAENWRSGIPLGEAFKSFCQEIVANGTVS